MTEINESYFCSVKSADGCPFDGNCTNCVNYHSRWPTPPQFEEEYGRMPNGLHFWYYDTQKKEWDWNALVWHEDERERTVIFNWSLPIVIACTPYGKPPNDWRPE